MLPADLVVIAAGIQPKLPFEITPVGAVSSAKDGSVLVDPLLKTRGFAQNIYAAGDVATFPDFRSGADIRIEHWNIAVEQGKH